MQRVYFDNAATTPLDKKVIKTMTDFELEYYGNPNSIHREGQKARAKIDTARAEIGEFLHCKPQEIIFTSGATESNNLAVQGVVSYYLYENSMKPHVITTLLEHQSVYNVVKELQKRDIIEATFVKPDRDGRISTESVIKEIRDNTVLISAIFVSNEIGTVLPIREIGRQLADVNKNQQYKIIFHTDAVQAVKYYNCNVEKLGVDLITLSAHKINGPKGIGALYIKTGTKLGNLMFGGSQEYGKRPGTQNSVGIIGFAKAIEILGTLDKRQKAGEKIRKLSDKLILTLKENEKIDINGPIGEDRTPDNVNFTVIGADHETLITKLDLAGFAVSTGSACVSGSSEPSHVIEALGKINDIQAATVRVTFGKENTEPEVKEFIKTLQKL